MPKSIHLSGTDQSSGARSPGIGTLVAALPEARAGEKKRLLQREVEQLVVEAKRLGLDVGEVVEAVEAQWARLEKPMEVSRR
jgi:hypothetical protein